MSRLLEFILSSILISVFTVAFLFFFTLHYLLKDGDAAGCTWYVSARAWIDANADGLVDPGESPLSDVKINVAEVRTQPLDLRWPAITDQHGAVQWSVPVPGCADTVFEISVDIPEGYRTTTRPRLAVQPDLWQASSSERVYYFGFVPER